MFKFIFWTLVVFFVIRWLMKPFLKYLVVKSAQKMAQNMQQQQAQQQRPKYPEGSIHVDRIPEEKPAKGSKQSSKDEYIDFEEIK